MSLTRKILSNTIWQVLGKLATAVLGIISIKVITGYLNTELYGQYINMFDYISFFAIAADFGLYTIGVREMAKKDKPVDFVLGNILAIRLILLVITMVTAGIVTNFIPKYSGTIITQAIWLVTIVTALTMVSGTLNSVLQYRLKMFAANICLILSKITSVGYIVLTIFVLYPEQPLIGFTHLLYGGIFGGLVLLATTSYFVAKTTSIRLILDRPYITYLLKQSAPYGLSLVLSTIYFRIDAMFITFIRGYSENAIYGIPLKLMEILSVIPVFFMNSLLPTLTEHLQTSVKKAEKIVNNAFRLLFTLALPILIGGYILAFPITFVVSSPQYLSGYHCVNNMQIVYQTEAEAVSNCDNTEIDADFKYSGQIEENANYIYQQGSDIAFKYIIAAVFFSFLNTLFAFSLVALNQQNKLLIINTIGVIFNIVTNLILIPTYGFRGAAITTICSEMLVLLGTYYFYSSYRHFQIPVVKIINTIIAGLLMGTTIYYLHPITYQYLQNWNIFLLIPIGALIYGLYIYLTKTITYQELRTFLAPED